jgi:hypothetical protein
MLIFFLSSLHLIETFVHAQITGDLRGGLGQLVDGKYGANNFKAPGENGIVRGMNVLSSHLGLFGILKTQVGTT